MNEEEELNLDDVFDVPRPQYEINRQKLNESRVLEADRFPKQVDQFTKFGQQFFDPEEQLLDMAIDAGILSRTLGEDFFTTGIPTVIQRRLAKRVLSDATDYWYKTLKTPEPSDLLPNVIKEGGVMDIGAGTPPPTWRKTPSAAEKALWMNRFENDVFMQLDKKGRPIHISKMIPNAYKELGKFRSEWNTWAKNNQFIRELSDKPATAYVEHLVRKAESMDWFWSLPNEKRFRKGSRHSPNNVRILYDNRYKSLKDSSEAILYKLQENTLPINRLVIDLDIPKMKGKSITYQSGTPRDVVVKRVDGTVVGRIGDYYDVLYAPPKELREKLGTNINPDTNRPYIDLSLSEKAISEQVTKWRSDIIRGKLQFIINMAPTLKGKTKKAKFQYQGSAMQQDMVDFLKRYEFLDPSKKFRKTLKSDPINSPRGGKPIVTEKEQVAEKVKKETEGIFISGEQQSKIIKSKYKRSMFSKDRDDILKNVKDDLDDIFPDDRTRNNRKPKK
tara:strand:- start:174 stop:1679 length:1506 start_codon:yes stop_codon:yes gene_type:complete